MLIKSVVIDFGGVLVRTLDRSYRQKWEQKLGLSDGKLEELVFNSSVTSMSTIGQASQDEIWGSVQDNLSLNTKELEKLKVDFWEGDFIDTTLMDSVKSLRPKFRTAILSNAWMGARELFKDVYNIIEGETVDKIIVSCEVGLVKPDPDIYRHTAKQMDVQLGEILFIDDFKKNIDSASKLGMKTHLFSIPEEAIELLNSLVR